MNRKYRQGYSFSSNKSKVETHKDFKEYKKEINKDAIVDEKEEDAFTCSNNKEVQIINYKPTSIIFVCDTPPKKNIDDERLLNEPKKSKENDTKKHLEPFNMASLIVLLLIVIGVIQYFWALIILIIALNIISLVRIKRNPQKYYKFSKTSARILLLILLGIGALIAVLFLFFYILAVLNKLG